MRHTSWVVWKLSPYLHEDKIMNMKYNYIVMKMGPKAPTVPEGPWGSKAPAVPKGPWGLQGPGGLNGLPAHHRSSKEGRGAPETSSNIILTKG